MPCPPFAFWGGLPDGASGGESIQWVFVEPGLKRGGGADVAVQKLFDKVVGAEFVERAVECGGAGLAGKVNGEDRAGIEAGAEGALVFLGPVEAAAPLGHAQ
jgi:hypothetical protein